MERREEDEEMNEEKGEGSDNTEGDDDEETAERSDDNTKEGIKAARDGGGGEGSKGCKEQNDVDRENYSVKKRVSAGRTSFPGHKSIPGIIYLGHIPPRLRPKHLRNMLSSYGEVGRIFLQPEGRGASPLTCCVPTLWFTFFCVSLSEESQGSQS